MKDSNAIQTEINELEESMLNPYFWNDKNHAQSVIKKIQELKDELLGAEKYDKGSAILSILSGAGGDDAEDFTAMLVRMYTKYFDKKGFSYALIHQNENDHGGYRNISFEVSGRSAYGLLKNESGVHRLVRISPFNAKSLRHTSFSLVEVIPKFDKNSDPIEIRPEDLKIEFSKAGGPGGQNVNKRETAVRIVHIPTNLSVHVATERSQEQNRDRAMEMLKGKLFKKQEEDKAKIAAGMTPTKSTEIEWGSQIRNYVLHPYKLVKDLRTGVETSNVDKVLEDGDIDEFITAEQNLSLGNVL
ncbi:MAG: PCRF domain-containing protein [Candidatus Nomurabacteria bacterium]|nr:PCRF domain-containing protein [Candidatus Nomurabacteria bacterium]